MSNKPAIDEHANFEFLRPEIRANFWHAPKIQKMKSLSEILKPICESQLSIYAQSLNYEAVMCILQHIDHKNPVIAIRATNKSCGDFDEYTVLHWAAKHGQFSVIEYISRFITDLNPNDVWGMTPLHFAAENGHLDIVDFLIRHVQDKNPKAFSVNSPLDLASRSGHLEVVKFLMQFPEYR